MILSNEEHNSLLPVWFVAQCATPTLRLQDPSIWQNNFFTMEWKQRVQMELLIFVIGVTINTYIKESSYHYIDVKMSEVAYQVTSLAIVYSTVHSDADKRNIKYPRHRPLCREFTGDRWIPRAKGQ